MVQEDKPGDGPRVVFQKSLYAVLMDTDIVDDTVFELLEIGFLQVLGATFTSIGARYVDSPKVDVCYRDLTEDSIHAI